MQECFNNGNSHIIKRNNKLNSLVNLQKSKSFIFNKTFSKIENVKETNENSIFKEIKVHQKDIEKLNDEGKFRTGRWEIDEHKKFIEAIIKYGNDWKLVQKYICTRSSAQARSHAQKFFMKIKRSNILEKNFDFTKNSIKCLKDIISKMNTDQYLRTIKALNLIVFDKKNKKVISNLKSQEKNIDIVESSKRKHTKSYNFAEEKKVIIRNESNSHSTSENNISTRVKQSFDENENCFQSNFLSSFNYNIKKEEYLNEDDDEKSGIFFQNSILDQEIKNERKISLEAEHCMMFQNEY